MSIGDYSQSEHNLNFGVSEFITAREASKLIKRELQAQGIPFTSVSAKTVSFSDLARGERIYVTVKGWENGYESPSRYAFIAGIAQKNGFFRGCAIDSYIRTKVGA